MKIFKYFYHILLLISLINAQMTPCFSFEKLKSKRNIVANYDVLASQTFIKPKIAKKPVEFEFAFRKIRSTIINSYLFLRNGCFFRFNKDIFISFLGSTAYFLLFLVPTALFILFEGILFEYNLTYAKSAEFLKNQAPKVVSYWEINHSIPQLKKSYIDFNNDKTISSDELIKSIFVWIKKHHVYPPLQFLDHLGNLDSPEVLESRYLHCYHALEMFYGLLQNHQLENRIVMVDVVTDYQGEQVAHVASLFLHLDKKGALTDVSVLDLTYHYVVNGNDDYLYQFPHKRIGVYSKKSDSLVYYDLDDLRKKIKRKEVLLEDFSPKVANSLAVKNLNPYYVKELQRQSSKEFEAASKSNNYTKALARELQLIRIIKQKKQYFKGSKHIQQILDHNHKESLMMLLMGYGNSASFSFNTNAYKKHEDFLIKGDKVLKYLKPYFNILDESDKKLIDWFIGKIKREPENVLFKTPVVAQEIDDPLLHLSKIEILYQKSLEKFNNNLWIEAKQFAREAHDLLLLFNNVPTPVEINNRLTELNNLLIELQYFADYNDVLYKFKEIEDLLMQIPDLYNSGKVKKAHSFIQKASKKLDAIDSIPADLSNNAEELRKEIMRLAPFFSFLNQKQFLLKDMNNIYHLADNSFIAKTNSGGWLYVRENFSLRDDIYTDFLKSDNSGKSLLIAA